MKVEIHRSEKYNVLYDLPPNTDTVICIGGRGGMKTYEVSKFLACQATIFKKRCVILRDEKALIKESILNEIWARYDTANEDGILDKYYKKLETELKDRETGETLVYTKGFRASNNEKRANLKGAANIDIAVIEEGEDIRDEEKYNTFVDSLRKEGCLIIIMLNTPDIGHFLVKRFFNTEQIEDGYYKVIAKKLPGFVCIQTTFHDNPHLPKHIVANYNGYGDKSHHLYNPHYYYTAILGYASTGRKGQILKKAKPIKREDYLALPFREKYSQDFGTSSPAPLVGCKYDGNKCYARLLNYEPMDVLELAKLYCTLGFNKNDKVVADCAEPDTINKLSKGFKELSREDYLKYPSLSNGFYVVPCVKGPGSIEAGLSLLIGMELYIVEEDWQFWNEINNYIYDVDKYGNPTDSPIDAFNHAIDALRYNVMDEKGSKLFGV